MKIQHNQYVASGKFTDALNKALGKLFSGDSNNDGNNDYQIQIDSGTSETNKKGIRTEVDVAHVTALNGDTIDLDIAVVYTIEDPNTVNYVLNVLGSHHPGKAYYDQPRTSDAIAKCIKDYISMYVKDSEWSTAVSEPQEEEDEEAPVEESVRIKAKFSSINGSIKLTDIRCDADPATALMVIDNVTNDEEFANKLNPESYYDINCKDYDITYDECNSELDDNDKMRGYMSLLKSAYNLINVIAHVRANAVNREDVDQIPAIHNINNILYQIYKLQEFCANTCMYCPDIVTIARDMQSVNILNSIDIETAIELIHQAILNYIDSLTLFQCIIPEVELPVINSWICELEEILESK